MWEERKLLGFILVLLAVSLRDLIAAMPVVGNSSFFCKLVCAKTFGYFADSCPAFETG